jgi:hypothetical protein
VTAITILLHNPLNPNAGGHVITVVGSGLWHDVPVSGD